MLVSIGDKKFFVQFHHESGVEFPEPLDYYKGRATVAELFEEFTESQQEVCEAWAFCSPKDSFRKSTGRKVAYAKLLKAMEELGIISSKEDRTALWNTYFENFRKEK